MKKFSLISMLFLVTIDVFGQGLNGIVVNEENVALDGAHVYLLDDDIRVHTDHHGEFHLDRVHVGDSIMVSYVGYQSQTFVVTNLKERVHIILIVESTFLEEVTIAPVLNGLSFNATVNNKTTPLTNTQQVLTAVPGLFIGQHAGGGKAEQIFLRGFDVDNGTDMAISVDGMPVNMVSQAKGQGNADLHFVYQKPLIA